MDALLRCIAWDNHLPSLEKQLGFRTVTAPARARWRVLRCSPERGGLADGKLRVLWAELCSHSPRSPGNSYTEDLAPRTSEWNCV